MLRFEKNFYYFVAFLILLIFSLFMKNQVVHGQASGTDELFQTKVHETKTDIVDKESIMESVIETSAQSETSSENTESEFTFLPYNLPPDENFKEFPLDDDLQQHIYNLCEEYHISYSFVISVIWIESMFDSDAKNNTCKGLMQINEPMHKERMERLGVTDLYDPYQNVKVGMDYLVYLFEKYEDCHTVLMSYHGGEALANRLIKKGIYSSSYSRWVCKTSEELTEIYGY